ncbi:hypothetical protein [Clostridium botulinum]|uniref:hypothetical protein n=1 Tax=Clostridium botulinum TaxID=1491 RepID=UPI001C9B1CF7|nr:hypothetical protein [Clostridium botulinum]MBY6838719.1 hypothetical protein [Clostridium botulinum]
MCKFCEEMGTEIKIPQGTTYSDDNICEYVRTEGEWYCCEGCKGCADWSDEFSLSMKWNNYLDMSYFKKINDLNNVELIIHPISEGIKIKYCPFCGRKLED